MNLATPPQHLNCSDDISVIQVSFCLLNEELHFPLSQVLVPIRRAQHDRHASTHRGDHAAGVRRFGGLVSRFFGVAVTQLLPTLFEMVPDGGIFVPERLPGGGGRTDRRLAWAADDVLPSVGVHKESVVVHHVGLKLSTSSDHDRLRRLFAVVARRLTVFEGILYGIIEALVGGLDAF